MTRLLLALLAALPIVPAVLAQEQAKPALRLELNALEPTGAGCRTSFVVANELGLALDRAAFELALFDTKGGIDRIVALEFKNLPPARTKVLQFDLQGLDCDQLGRVLINDVSACEGAGVEPGSCLVSLVPGNRTDITFGL